MAYDVLRGPDSRDGYAVHPRDADAEAGAPVRVGWLAGPGFGPVEPAVTAAVSDAAAALADLGCVVEPVRLPILEANDFTRA